LILIYVEFTYHSGYAKHVTVMILRNVILGDVGEMGQIIGILASAVNIADLVFANGLLFLQRNPIKTTSLFSHLIDCDLFVRFR